MVGGVGGAGAGRAGGSIVAPRAEMRTASCKALLAFAAMCGPAFAGEDGGNGASAPTPPNIYFDLRTNYATLPANTLSVGVGNSSLFSTLSNLVRQFNPATLPVLPGLPTLSSPASQSAWIDVPLTVMSMIVSRSMAG